MTTRTLVHVEALQCAWLAPFDSDAAKANSQYCASTESGLVRLLESSPPSPFAVVAHDAFRSFVLDDAYPCLAARASLNRMSYRFGAYSRLNDAPVSEGLMRDIYAFVNERRTLGDTFTTFVAVFREPLGINELDFEAALWGQLRRLRELDRAFHVPDPSVSNNPDDPNFSFSLAGNAFFIVGLHGAASREARRFAWPTLIFNAHDQFQRLKEKGSFPGLQSRIRVRDIALQGSINGNLAEFGHHTEARQYSGRQVEENWKCPLSAESSA